MSKLEVIRDFLRVGRVEIWFDGRRCPDAPDEIACGISRAIMSPDTEVDPAGIQADFRGIVYHVPWEAVFEAIPTAVIWSRDYPTDRDMPRVERCKVMFVGEVEITDAPRRHLKLVE